MDILADFPYYQTREFTASLSGRELCVVSKPGLPHWDEVTPSQQLLAEAVDMRKEGQVILMGCGHGALGVALARQGKPNSLCLMDASWIALRVAKKTLAVNGFPDVQVEPLQYPFPLNDLQTILIVLPKGRKLARRWFVEAWETLQPGGVLYLAGANQDGIQSVIQDAGSLFGNATVLAYRKGCRVARMLKQAGQEEAPGWAAESGIATGSWIEFTASVNGETFRMRSLPGVFSSDRIDAGTAMLLQIVTRESIERRRVLDFGCGYGLIGMMAARLGAAWVDLLDVDLSAVAAAQENCSLNEIPNTQVRPSDVLDAIGSERYDLILSNPPFHTGKQVEYRMAQTFIGHSRHILNPGGRLMLVANRFIRYDRLMNETFGNVEKLAETGKFHVLESLR